MSRSTIRVYEHQRLRVGELGLTEAHLDALDRSQKRLGDKFFEVGRRDVRFKQYVGYVQVGELGIEILPKIDRDMSEPRCYALLLEMLRAARLIHLETPTPSQLDTHRAPLLDLFLVEFLREVEILLHQGLAKGYRVVRSNERAFRGRLCLREQLTENLVRQDRFFVEHQAYDFDNEHNRILAGALDVLRRVPLTRPVAARHARAASRFPTLTKVTIDAHTFDRLRYSRQTERYRRAIRFAEMILRRFSPRLRSGGDDVLSILFDMNALWETWVARMLASRLPPHLELQVQTSRRFFESSDGHRRLKPDLLVLDRATRRVRAALDTKWKRPSRGRPSDEDLRQMFAYNASFETDQAMLLYPSLEMRRTTSAGSFEPTGTRCEARYVAVEAPAESFAALVDALSGAPRS